MVPAKQINLIREQDLYNSGFENSWEGLCVGSDASFMES